jgi:hypothetical protein
MLYRPKYCCNCGEKIERDEWRIWTSRRFCALCETEYKPYELLPRVVVILSLVFMLFGVGSYFRSGNPSPDQKLNATSTRPSQKLKPATLYATPEGSEKVLTPGGAMPVDTEEGRSQINEQPIKEKRTSDEVVLYCGAPTKKGSPCTRRVKKKGFCWQHAKATPVAPARF